MLEIPVGAIAWPCHGQARRSSLIWPWRKKKGDLPSLIMKEMVKVKAEVNMSKERKFEENLADLEAIVQKPGEWGCGSLKPAIIANSKE